VSESDHSLELQYVEGDVPRLGGLRSVWRSTARPGVPTDENPPELITEALAAAPVRWER